MALLGLSIIIVSFSYLCYRFPPSSWTFLSWLQQPAIQNAALNPPPKLNYHDGANDSKNSSSPAKYDLVNPTIATEDSDRIAMPPPPPPPSRRPNANPDSSSAPRASNSIPSPSVPSFTLAADDEPSVPSFPAANSAQRASGGARAPPRLNPVSSPPGLMAPPSSRGPLPNRTPNNQSNSNSLALPPTHSAIPSKPRKKVLLTPGHSPLDWARLSSSPTANLSGLPAETPYLRVPPSLLRQFTGRKGKDAWTVLGGKVYNITPYLPYHPGGEPELMKAAGRDGTRLFGEVHPWVNWEGMLEGCLVGIAVEEGEIKAEGKLDEMD